MKKLLMNSILGISLVSWVLFLAFSFLYFFPNQAIKTVSHSIAFQYNLSYSAIANEGTFRHPLITFSNIVVLKNGDKIFSADQASFGITISPQTLLGNLEVNLLHVKKAYLLIQENIDGASSLLNINIDDNISLDIEDLFLETSNQNLIINAKFNNLLLGSANGELKIIHRNKVSNFSISSDGFTSNFLLNLNTFNWLSIFPSNVLIPVDSINFGINMLGTMNSQGSSLRGSISYEDANFNNFSLQRNHGSFLFQSKNGLASLSLQKFLHPFIDESFPIKLNFIKKSILIPKLYVSDQLVLQRKPKFTNLAVDNFMASLNSGLIKYSGIVADLDLLNVYFDEVTNLQGVFSGLNNDFKFIISPSNSLIKQKDSDVYPIQVNGKGIVNNLGLQLEANIKEPKGLISLKLDLPSQVDQSITLKLSGQNVSKKLILISLPENFTKVHQFINQNIELSPSNNIFLNYMSPNYELASRLILKLSLDESILHINPSLKFTMKKGIIEMTNDHLYVVSSSGFINQFSMESFHGNLTFLNQDFQYTSQHELSTKEILGAVGNITSAFKPLNASGMSKGIYNISSKKTFNTISVETGGFEIPVHQNHLLLLKKGQFYALNFDKIFGRLHSQYLNQNPIIFLKGENLLDKYKLDFISEISLKPSMFIPDSSLFQLSGIDSFLLALTIKKNLPPILNIFSELEGIAFNSQLSFLQKSKNSILSTDIVISNFAQPNVYIRNKLLELKINFLDRPSGYIAIGKEIPMEYNFLRKAKGLNFYLGLDTFNFDQLKDFSKGQAIDENIKLNNFIFDINNIEIANNQFHQMNGSLSLKGKEIKGTIQSDKLSGKFIRDKSGFLKVELQDTQLQDISFLKNQKESFGIQNINARLIVKNSSIDKLQIKFLDVYLLKNKNVLTLDNINLNSNLISISPLSDTSKAYFSIDNKNDIYKLRGIYMVKDSLEIPVIQDLGNFSYFNGNLNLQWQNLQRLKDIEGTVDFILKDLIVSNKTSNSIAFNLLGILNLKNILGKVANLDLTIEEFRSTKLNRLQGKFVFSQSKMRLAAPLFIDTNAAKMKWIGQINKNARGELANLDLSLDLRVRIGENIPWYAAVLGGIPAVAGSALISEIFENNIDDLSNYQYEVSGMLNAPQIKRMN